MSQSPPFINRELSWLEFNQRVLSEAERTDLPLLDRIKFLAITDSNLDEFFQVRIGGLHSVLQSSPHTLDICGLSPASQLELIHERVSKLIDDQYKLLKKLLVELKGNDLELLEMSVLSAQQQQSLSAYFSADVLPVLTPLELLDDSETSIPLLRLCIAAELHDPTENSSRHVFIPLPSHLPRRITVESAENKGFVLLEDLVSTFCTQLFPDEEVKATTAFRLTRNGDIAVQEEDTTDFADEMEDVLVARQTAETVRLQIDAKAPTGLKKRLTKIAGSVKDTVFLVPGPIALADFMELAFVDGKDDLRAPAWKPQDSPDIDPSISIFQTLKEQDILLLHPYQSFDPVCEMIEEAANDENTLVIKQVLYRTAKKSRIVDALIRAAENGKQVVALVELKARFDEARNLDRAEDLQRAGVQVVYGVRGLKTHAKITLIVRKEDGRIRRYVHLGTGNYNESTAKLYTDVSYFTSRPEYSSDASLFFNAVTGRSKLVRFEKLVPAPTHMRRHILEMIEGETARAREGHEAHIIAKVNSLQDKGIIEALYEASRAGVKIQLNVRGICCLKTGDHDGAKNIEVISIIDQYLEHPRIFYFHQGGQPAVYIASADWMTRNLDKRIELLTPIEDEKCRQQLIDTLKACFKDNQQAYRIKADGSNERVTRSKGAKKFRLQAHMQQIAEQKALQSQEQRAASFEPHLPAED